MKERKREPWRLIVALVAVAYIVYMWVQKGVGADWGMIPREQLVPMLATSLAVTLVKVGVIAAAILLVKWVVGKIQNRKP